MEYSVPYRIIEGVEGLCVVKDNEDGIVAIFPEDEGYTEEEIQKHAKMFIDGMFAIEKLKKINELTEPK